MQVTIPHIPSKDYIMACVFEGEYITEYAGCVPTFFLEAGPGCTLSTQNTKGIDLRWHFDRIYRVTL